jgi:ABC-type Na+ efflux pump permease subunit
LNSFAQFPVRRDATARSAATAPAEVAPSGAVEGIAERFPTTAGFVTALLASTASATNDAPESPVVSVTNAIPATRGTSTIDDGAGGLDLRFAMSLLLALCVLSALVLWGWSRSRTQSAMR